MEHTLDKTEIAGLLGYSVRWVDQRMKEGRFPIQPLEGLGKKKRWARAAVERYLTGKRRGWQ